jgi:hypothetical protein
MGLGIGAAPLREFVSSGQRLYKLKDVPFFPRVSSIAFDQGARELNNWCRLLSTVAQLAGNKAREGKLARLLLLDKLRVLHWRVSVPTTETDSSSFVLTPRSIIRRCEQCVLKGVMLVPPHSAWRRLGPRLSLERFSCMADDCTAQRMHPTQTRPWTNLQYTPRYSPTRVQPEHC